jgi:glycosyltransferase involved in cell wall biosynthesis
MRVRMPAWGYQIPKIQCHGEGFPPRRLLLEGVACPQARSEVTSSTSTPVARLMTSGMLFPPVRALIMFWAILGTKCDIGRYHIDLGMTAARRRETLRFDLRESPLDTPNYSVVIPVYNSASSLEELHSRLRAVMEARNEKYEILFVNDASLDDSLAVLKRIQQRHPEVIIIDLMRNFGQHNAVLCGLSLAAGAYVITMDDDLQHPPEEISKLIAAMRDQDVDVVVGRYMSKQHSPHRNLGSWLVKRLSWHTLGVPYKLKLNSFRLMTRQVAVGIIRFAGPRPRIGMIICQITRNIINVDVEHHPRRDGRSGYGPRKLISSAIDNIVSYSALPLRLLAYGGFLSAATAVILAVFYLVNYLMGGIGVTGFTSLLLLLLFSMGLTMSCFGIVGEYLMRIIWAAERRPTFVIRETIRSSGQVRSEAKRARVRQ